jgi:nicotinamidase/pyrazinamidase
MRALILVDLQIDFMPGGALAVPDGDAVIPVANRLLSAFPLAIATQDWHPADHISFAVNHPGSRIGDVMPLPNGTQQVLWPVHCVQNSPGARFHPDLDLSRIETVVKKGMDPRVDSYSGFFDNDHRTGTGLAEILRGRGCTDLIVMGLASDYCVKFTVLDAVQLGFKVTLVTDGCRGVNVSPGDGDRALSEMQKAGVRLSTAATLT